MDVTSMAGFDALVSIGVQIPVVFIFGVFVLQLNKSNREAAAQHHTNWRNFMAAQNQASGALITALSAAVDHMADRMDKQLALFAQRDEQLVDLIRDLRASPATRAGKVDHAA